MGFIRWKKRHQKKKHVDVDDSAIAIVDEVAETTAPKEAPKIFNVNTKETDDVECALVVGSYLISKGHMTWRVTCYSSTEPDADIDYFSALCYGPRSTNGIGLDYQPGNVISAFIPCIDETDKELQNTIRSLYRQRMPGLPTGYRVEAVIVLDGVDRMSNSMVDLLENVFGVMFNSRDAKTDPFLMFPNAETVVVTPVNEVFARSRIPVVEGTVGGYTLVVKRHNRSKMNSQMWWLGSHAARLDCRYAFGTNCGTIFSKTALVRLVRRMEAESDLQAVSGNQRIMSSKLQGDGRFEYVHDFFSYNLRQLQRFENEIDQVFFRNVHDTLGAMHSSPSSCDLFRYKALGSLSDGILYNYFKIFQHRSEGLLVGNVKLAEDRIPFTLLSFPPKESNKFISVQPEGCWWRTGFVHGATYQVQAERPLDQLVKQRRRRINGSFALSMWMLVEGLVTNSNKAPLVRSLSWILLLVNVIQGFVVRMLGPAFLIAWAFRFGLFIPELFANPSTFFNPGLGLVNLDIGLHDWGWGVGLASFYALLYIAFTIGHMPQISPLVSKIEIDRYSHEVDFHNDDHSAYRAWLFYAAIAINYIAMIMYAIHAVGMLYILGWDDTPLPVRVVLLMLFSPFFLSFFDSILHRDFRGLYSMVVSAPVALPFLVFSCIWLPAYASSRLSDLTWGNRKSASIAECMNDPDNAKLGAIIARIFVMINIFIATVFIGLTWVYPPAFTMSVLIFASVMFMSFIISFLDILYRIITCYACTDATRDNAMILDSNEPGDNFINCNQATGYAVMVDETPAKEEHRSANVHSDTDTDTSHLSDDDEDEYLQLFDGESNRGGIAMVGLAGAGARSGTTGLINKDLLDDRLSSNRVLDNDLYAGASVEVVGLDSSQAHCQEV